MFAYAVHAKLTAAIFVSTALHIVFGQFHSD